MDVFMSKKRLDTLNRKSLDIRRSEYMYIWTSIFDKFKSLGIVHGGSTSNLCKPKTRDYNRTPMASPHGYMSCITTKLARWALLC